MTDRVSYPIDFEAYTIEEIEQLVRFLSKIETYHSSGRKKPSHHEITKAYRAYRSILNNLSEEKRIDKAFYKQTGISIYRTMQKIEQS